MGDLLPKDSWGYEFPAAGEAVLSFFSFIGTDKKQLQTKAVHLFHLEVCPRKWYLQKKKNLQVEKSSG